MVTFSEWLNIREAKIPQEVQEIINQEIANGMSLDGILYKLSELGITNKNGRPFTLRMIHDFVASKILAGKKPPLADNPWGVINSQNLKKQKKEKIPNIYEPVDMDAGPFAQGTGGGKRINRSTKIYSK